MSGLLEEIKQTKPFASLEEEVYLNLQRTAEALSWKVVAALKPAELTPVQYNVLRILRGAAESKSKGLTCKEISERLVTKDSDITRLLDRLEDRELVERARDIEDRRSIVSQITKKGLKLLNELDHLVAACSRQQLNHLGSDLLEQFNALLVLARSNIR